MEKHAEEEEPQVESIPPCLGCGFEPDIVNYWRRDGERVGYSCSCGAAVVDSLFVGSFPQ